MITLNEFEFEEIRKYKEMKTLKRKLYTAYALFVCLLAYEMLRHVL